MTLLYDDSFDGFLTAVFEAFRLHLPVSRIVSESRYEVSLFDEEPHRIVTDSSSASRVWTGIVQRLDNDRVAMLYGSFLSELTGIEDHLWKYLVRLFREGGAFAANPLAPEGLPLLKAAEAVKREQHRFLGFVRFQKTEEGLLFAEIEPQYDVLLLLVGHFRRRYPQKRWAIFDSKRGKGVLCENGEVCEIQIPDFHKGYQGDDFCDLWKQYYNSVTIAERKNLRLMCRELPRKYWAHLPERAVRCPVRCPK